MKKRVMKKRRSVSKISRDNFSFDYWLNVVLFFILLFLAFKLYENISGNSVRVLNVASVFGIFGGFYGYFFNLVKPFKKSISWIKDSKEFIYIAVLLFAIFGVIGFFFQDLIKIFFNSFFGFDLAEKILGYLKDVLKNTEGMGLFELTKFIFFNNLQSSFYGMIFGSIFGIFPLISIIFNGYLIGFVSILGVKSQGILVLWRLFPHGIFELPAVLISLGLGLRIGTYLFIKKNKKLSFNKTFMESLRAFFMIMIPLLLIAAIIESILIFFS